MKRVARRPCRPCRGRSWRPCWTSRRRSACRPCRRRRRSRRPGRWRRRRPCSVPTLSRVCWRRCRAPSPRSPSLVGAVRSTATATWSKLLADWFRKALRDGVGEDQGAGDEGDAEHDGEHGHQQPGLVREHVAQGGTEHGGVSPGMVRGRRRVEAARCGVPGPVSWCGPWRRTPSCGRARRRRWGWSISSTIRPSARKITRSA